MVRTYQIIAALFLALCLTTKSLGSNGSMAPTLTVQSRQPTEKSSRSTEEVKINMSDPTPVADGKQDQVHSKTESGATPPAESKSEGQGAKEFSQPASSENSLKPEAAKNEMPPPTEKTAPTKASPTTPKKEGDRRWIIKQKTSAETPYGKKTPAPTFKWANDIQKERCEARLNQLKDRFQQARHFSVMGDSCATAEYAKAFIRIHRLCEEDCPEGFLTENGFSPQILENVEKLMELGERRCLTTQ